MGFISTICYFAAVAAILLHVADGNLEISPDIIAEMATEVMHEYNIVPLHGKHRSVDDISMVCPPKKHIMIKYNHERGFQCVMPHYLAPVPIFPDKTFEHTFRIK